MVSFFIIVTWCNFLSISPGFQEDCAGGCGQSCMGAGCRGPGSGLGFRALGLGFRNRV